jgi:hypothetical protein
MVFMVLVFGGLMVGTELRARSIHLYIVAKRYA